MVLKNVLATLIWFRKLGFLDPTGLSPTSDPGRILDAVNGSIEAVKKCEYGYITSNFSLPCI